MAIRKDLSEHIGFGRPEIKYVGWLSAKTGFPTEQPNDEILRLLWVYCSVSVNATRGTHACDICGNPMQSVFTKGAERLRLGSAEIWLFSLEGAIYRAPNLIYHYVADHHYQPPDIFLANLLTMPAPPDERYFARLRRLGIEWEPTLAPNETST
jgi:hypothetical protein